MMVVSNNCKNDSAFDPTGIVMGGHEVEQLEELKLVGYIFDEALSWGLMIGALAKKARTRTDAIRRMTCLVLSTPRICSRCTPHS